MGTHLPPSKGGMSPFLMGVKAPFLLTFIFIYDIIQSVMKRLVWHIIAGIVSLWLADTIITGVEIKANWQALVLIGSILGLINFFVKPIISVITLPLKILTLGLFGLVINMAIIWLLDIIFPELVILGIIPLFWTAIIVWLTALILGVYKKTQ